jgi:hypothetical protein
MMFFRRTLPVLVCFVIGVAFIGQYYIPAWWSQKANQHVANTVKIVIGFSYVIGLQSLAHLHIQRIRRQVPGWGYSFLVFVGLTVMVFFGLIGEFQKLMEIVFKRPFTFASFQGYTSEGPGEVYDWFFNHVYTSAATTMFSMLAFFIASAAYRTFRAKTWESALLLVAAIIVIFGRVPLSNLISERIPEAAEWIMAYPNMAVKRGIFIGIALGIVGTSLRVIFGIERAYIGGD